VLQINLQKSYSSFLYRSYSRGSYFAKESPAVSICPFLHFFYFPQKCPLLSMSLLTSSSHSARGLPLGLCPFILLSSTLLGVLAHPFFWHVRTTSVCFSLVLYILCLDLFSDVCISDSFSFGLSHYCPLEFHLICLYVVFPSLSASKCLPPYNSTFLKHTFYIVVLHFLCLSFIMCSLLNCRIFRPVFFFRLFHSVSRRFSLPRFRGT
jgi:hypothetical protein